MKNTNIKNPNKILTLILTVFLLVSLGIITSNLKNVRQPQSAAATQSKTFGASGFGSLYYGRNKYPADPNGTCSVTGLLFTGASYVSSDPDFKYRTWRSYLSFNTSGLAADVTVKSAVLRLTLVGDGTDNDFTLYVRDFNWRAGGLSCANDYGGDPPTATLASSSFNTANLPAVGTAFNVPITKLTTIKKGGTTTFMLTSNREEKNSGDPSAREVFWFKDPALIVNYTPPPAPTVDIKANGSNGPIKIAYNSGATISWVSSGALSCLVSPAGWTGTSGSRFTGNLTSSKTYTATCKNTGGSSSDSVVVNVLPRPNPPSQPPPSTSLGPRAQTTSTKTELNILKSIKVKLTVPYLLGKMQVPIKIGSFSNTIEVLPGPNEITIDVSKHKFTLGGSLTVAVGGDKTLVKKVLVRTKAPNMPVEVGALVLGDLNQDNKIDVEDTAIFIGFLAIQDQKGDVNLDEDVNSLDWGVLLINLGQKGD